MNSRFGPSAGPRGSRTGRAASPPCRVGREIEHLDKRESRSRCEALAQHSKVQPLEMIPAQVQQGVIQVEAVHEGGNTNNSQGVPCRGGNGGGVKNARGPWPTGTARTNPAG